jgi:hypothetical protein
VSDATALLSNAERTAEVSDTLSARFARELGAVLKTLERRLRGWTDSQPTSVTAQAARAAMVRQELRDLLERAGFDQLVAESSASLDRISDLVLRSAEGSQAASIPESLSLEIQGLQRLVGLDLLDQGDEIARQLWRAMVQSVVADTPHDTIVAALADTLDRSEAQIRTLFDTQVSIYTRQVDALQADGEPDEAFLYAGPVDGKIRPFCYERVGKVYTRSQIDRMDNGQLVNCYLTGGGYNCRHTWKAVSKFSELNDLVGTDERVPEVDSALKAVQRGTRKAA